MRDVLELRQNKSEQKQTKQECSRSLKPLNICVKMEFKSRMKSNVSRKIAEKCSWTPCQKWIFFVKPPRTKTTDLENFKTFFRETEADLFKKLMQTNIYDFENTYHEREYSLIWIFAWNWRIKPVWLWQEFREIKTKRNNSFRKLCQSSWNRRKSTKCLQKLRENVLELRLEEIQRQNWRIEFLREN